MFFFSFFPSFFHKSRFDSHMLQTDWSTGLINVQVGQFFSVGIGSGDDWYPFAVGLRPAPLKMVPPNALPSSLDFRSESTSISESMSSFSFSSFRSRLSLAKMPNDATVSALSVNSLPLKNSRWQMVGILNSSWSYDTCQFSSPST